MKLKFSNLPIILFIICNVFIGISQNSNINNKYKELPNPVPTDSSKWKEVSSTNIGWGSTNLRYNKELPPNNINKNSTINITAWKGEKVSSQLVIWSNKDIDKLSINIDNLVHQKSSYTIEGDFSPTSGFVRYVLTDELNKDGKGGCGKRPDASQFDSTLVSDPIDHLTKSISLQSNNTQPVWIQYQIPMDTPAGKYRSLVTVKDNNNVIGTLKVVIDVKDRVLPNPEEWSFFLDLWQNPFSIARIHDVDLWSQSHFDAMLPYMEMYKNAGGKSVTASIMHKPWNGQTYDYFETMVTWIKKADGSWEFDYTVFDRWVQFMLDLGINKTISCYTMIPWDLSFQYFDQATNSLKFIYAKPGDDIYKELWTSMLTSFSAHLKIKNWFDITYIAMDERPMDAMKEAISIIKNVDPNFKISLAGALLESLSDDIDYFCVPLRMKYPPKMKADRKEQNKITTYYTSCEEPFPNTFTFNTPSDCEWFGWYAAKEDLDGYLRWAYNSWVKDPLLDSRFEAFAAGDTYLIYPGARTSMRFEKLIAGIQAYEKVKILKHEFVKSNNKSGLKKIDKALKLFDENKLDESNSHIFVEQANNIINKL